VLFERAFVTFQLAVGAAVLGLGNIGPRAAMPVMEGKAVLFKQFAGVDAWPVCLDTQDTEEIIRAVQLIAPVYGGINLEDIAAPRCFEIEARLRETLDIPVFHDDQHGTAIVVVGALRNALRVVGKSLSDCTVVVCGVGAAGSAIIRLLLHEGPGDVVAVDVDGIVHRDRDGMDNNLVWVAEHTNRAQVSGSLRDALVGADGVHSRMRQGLFGADQPQFTGIIAWRGIVPMERLPARMERRVGVNWVGPGGHVVHYPLRGGAVLNFVGALERSDWRGESLSARGTNQELKADFAGAAGRLERIAATIRPEVIAFVGKAAYTGIFGGRVEHGLQERRGGTAPPLLLAPAPPGDDHLPDGLPFQMLRHLRIGPAPGHVVIECDELLERVGLLEEPQYRRGFRRGLLDRAAAQQTSAQELARMKAD